MYILHGPFIPSTNYVVNLEEAGSPSKKLITITTYSFLNQKPNTELKGKALNMKCSQSLKWILMRTIIMNITGITLVSTWCLCSK